MIELSSEVNQLGDSIKFYVQRNSYYAGTFLTDLFTPKGAFQYAEQTIDESKELNSSYLKALLEQVFNKNSSNIRFNEKTMRVLNQELEKVSLMESTIRISNY